MKLFSIITIALLGFCTVAEAAVTGSPKVTIHSTASVQDDNITLGEISDIELGAKKIEAQLASAVIGRAALPGLSRTITRGDIILKLRQAGIDPSSIDLVGAETVSVSSSETVVAPIQASSSLSPSPTATSLPVVSIKPGDIVDLILVDGPVTVRAKATAITSGALGMQISVRRENASHPIDATIIGAGQVQLEE